MPFPDISLLSVGDTFQLGNVKFIVEADGVICPVPCFDNEPPVGLLTTLCVVVWCDEDGSNTFNAGDTLVPNQDVKIKKNGVVIATVSTNNQGKATYQTTLTGPENLVVEVPPSITVGTETKILIDDVSPDSDFNEVTGEVPVTLTPGTTTDLEAGYEEDVVVGPTLDLMVQLFCDTTGSPIVGQPVDFILNGVPQPTINTDATGTATLTYSDTSGSIQVSVPTNYLTAAQNSKCLLSPAASNSDFDDVTGMLTVPINGLDQTVLAEYFECQAEITIINREATQTAPENIIFGARAINFPGLPGPTGASIYDPSKLMPDFTWDGGQTGQVNTAPQHTFDGMLDANTKYGYKVDFLYEEAGSYTVSVKAEFAYNDKKLQAVATRQVDVNPGIFLFGNTIFVDPDGVFPPGAQQNAFTYIEARQLARGLPGPVRIVFRDNKNHFMDPWDAWRSNDPSVLLTGQGTANPAILDYDQSATRIPFDLRLHDPNKEKYFKVIGLDIRNTWREVTETGLERKMSLTGSADDTEYALYANNLIRGFEIMWEGAANTSSNLNVVNNIVAHWRSFAILGEWPTLALSGNRIARQPNALAGGPKFMGHNDHGPARITGAHVTVHQNDTFNRTGWIAQFAVGTPIYTPQPSYRLNNADSYPNAEYNLQQNYTEGGFDTIHMQYVNGGSPLNQVLWAIEKNFFVGCWMTNSFGRIHFGGGTMRNNVMVLPDVDRIHTFLDGTPAGDNVDFFFGGFPGDIAGDPLAQTNPITVVHNTVINLGDPATGSEHPVFRDFVNTNGKPFVVTEDCNLEHEPNLGNTPYTLVDLTVINNARYEDYEAFDHAVIPNTATPDDTPTLGKVGAGSTAQQLNTTPKVCLDMLGNQRSIPDTIGAHVAGS